MKTLHLAIVGHANAGKTSFLRTLTRNVNFGVVSDKPGTTRHVEKISLAINDDESLVFYDTPGLEDSIALYDYIYSSIGVGEKLDGIDRLQRFLTSPEAEQRFNQEAKVIRQLLASDAGLYIIDVREPLLDKYHDELTILADSNKPLLAILNFTASEQSLEPDWKALLSRVGIHAIIRFDAIFPPIDGETRLYQSLALLLEPAKVLLENLIDKLATQQIQRAKNANKLIAETLIDVTACSRVIKPDNQQAINALQDGVRKREQKAIKALLQLYQFDDKYQTLEQMPIIEGRFESDLFNTEAIKLMGIHVSKGLVTGAIAGVGIDLAAGGMTLGAAALLGAVIGGASQTARHYGSKIMSKFSGKLKLTVDDTIICFLSLRLQLLKADLNLRSHANADLIAIKNPTSKLWQQGKLPKQLAIARAHPEWSALNKQAKLYDEQRNEIIDDLAQILD